MATRKKYFYSISETKKLITEKRKKSKTQAQGAAECSAFFIM